jgi:hypothetical protein
MASQGWHTGGPSDPAALPEWAVQKARTSLQLGMKAPEIEQQLITGGLDPAAAAALVLKVRDHDLSLGPIGSQGKSAPSKGWDTSDPTDPVPLPEWAVEKARASLRLGMKVPDVEQRLVAFGLSPVAAKDVVTRVLACHVRAEAAPLEHLTPTQPIEQLLAVVVAAVCILLGLAYGGMPSAFLAGVFTVFPLWRICLATGWTRWVGWFILVANCLYWLVALMERQ